MRPYVGEDGRLYFNYCRGAEYLYEKTKHISVGDRFDDGLISLLSYSGKINTVNVKRNCYNYTDYSSNTSGSAVLKIGYLVLLSTGKMYKLTLMNNGR